MPVNLLATHDNAIDLRIDYCLNDACATARMAWLAAMNRTAIKVIAPDHVLVREVLDPVMPRGNRIRSFEAGLVIISWQTPI